MSVLAGVLIVAAMLIGPAMTHALDVAPLYGAKCAACHGAEGEGTPIAPALKGNVFVTAGKPDEIKDVILKGRSGAGKKYSNFMADMPPGLALEAEADALVPYLKSDLQK